MKTHFPILLVSAVLAASCTSATRNKLSLKRQQSLDSVFTEFQQPAHPGCAVVVTKGDEVVFSKGYGLANLELDVPVTKNTVFDIASVSKQFAAYAVAHLIEEGKIAASDDIKYYFPEFKRIKDTITIAHLIHHTSGLRDWPQTLAIGGWSMEDQITYQQILRMAFLQRELNYPPGTEYSYTNTGYVLLAELVSRVTRMPFHEHIKRQIFEPLGMENSYFNHDIHSIIPNRASSYYRSAETGNLINYADNTTAMGSSSMFSTAEDIARWLIFLGKQRQSDPVVKRMHQRGVLKNGDTTHYAYGLWYEKSRQLPVIMHTGSWSGFRAITMRFPEEELGVVILSNYANFDRYGYAEKVAALFLENDYIPAGESYLPNGEDPALAAISGVYLSTPERIYEATEKAGKLELLVDGAIQYTLTKDARGVLSTLDEPKKSLSAFTDGNLMFGSDTLHKVAGSTASFSTYTGIYYSDELQATYQLEEKEGKLYANHIRYDSIALEPVAGDVFKTDAWFLARIRFIRNERQQVKGFQVFGGRVRRLYFRKVDL